MPSQQQDAVPHRALITVCAMLATLMQSLDSTIANVALPYMQGSLSASSDQITWVLTSYITAAAIMTAPVGWLSARFGLEAAVSDLDDRVHRWRRCCAASPGSLPEMVVFRLLQGVFGAALVPLSQSTMLNIYPPEKRGSAMAIWGMGVMVGPILGPTLGGYLTELYNWRWVFFVNLPFGILATAGMAAFLPKTRRGVGDEVRLVRLRRVRDGHCRVSVDARPRRDAGLVRLLRDHHRGGHRGAGVLPVRRAHVHRAEAVHYARSVQGPQSVGRPAGDVRGRDGAAVGISAAGAMAAGAGELSGGDRRAGDGAARLRHDGGDADRRAGCRTRSMRGC